MGKGIIYKIVSPHCDKCYIGSTKNRLCLRKALHMYHYRCYLQNKSKLKTTALHILEKGDCEFIPIETMEFDDIKQLRLREREIQEQYKAEGKLINTNHAYRSEEERKEQCRLNAKKMYERNFLDHKAKMREAYHKNKEIRNERSKQYYQQHKERISAYLKEKSKSRVLCECGIKYICSKEKHLAGLCHKKRMMSINNGDSKPQSESQVGAQEKTINESTT